MLWVAAAVAPTSCAKIWGIDDGIPFPPDASLSDGAGEDVTAQDSFVEAANEAGNDAGLDAADAADTNEAAIPTDAGDGGEAEACSPILSWCVDHCGTGPNNCGQATICGNICGMGDGIFCDASTNQCDCTTDQSWCTTRCGNVTDNCGRSDTCPTCGADACVPTGSPCAGLACGTATDTCHNTVNCGAGGTINCAGTEICDAGQCCQPNLGACTGMCNSAPNGCGGTTGCPPTCTGGLSCNESTNQCFCPMPTCSADQCGVITNGCNNTTTCPGCPNGQTCNNVTNMCVNCTLPTCGNACNTSVSNACGITICGPCQGSGGECVGNVCCTPMGCSVTNCMDTCNVFQQACCQDAGSCGNKGQPCIQACCTGLFCNGTTCEPPDEDGGGGSDSGGCLDAGSLCSSSPQCCSDNCQPIANPDAGPSMRCQ